LVVESQGRFGTLKGLGLVKATTFKLKSIKDQEKNIHDWSE